MSHRDRALSLLKDHGAVALVDEVERLSLEAPRLVMARGNAMSDENKIRPNEDVFIYVNDKPLGIGWAKADGSIEFPKGYVPADGHRIRFLQADEYAWDEFYHSYDDDAWECTVCGGSGVREYMDAPEEWGEDCPSEKNHLIECRECVRIHWDKTRAMAKFLWDRLTEREARPSAATRGREVH